MAIIDWVPVICQGLYWALCHPTESSHLAGRCRDAHFADEDRSSDKIQHPLMTFLKNLSANWKSIFFNLIKSVYEKPTVILNGGKFNDFLLISGTRQRCPLSPFLFNIVLGVLGSEIKHGGKKETFFIHRKSKGIY